MSPWVHPPSTPVRAVCTDCGDEWDSVLVHERDTGATYLSPHEECPACGSTAIDTSELDKLDIQERKLDARGIDY